MKNILIITLFVLVTHNCFGQFLTSSAEGKGSIPLPLQGLGVSVDIGKSEVAFGVNNYDRVFKSKSNAFKDNYFLGLNLSAKNEEGLANLFSSGDIVAAGDLLGFAGYSFTNTLRTVQKIDSSKRMRLHREQQKALGQAFNLYVKNLIEAVNTHASLIQNSELRYTVVGELTDTILSADGDRTIQTRLASYRPTDTSLNVYKKNLSTSNKFLFKRLNDSYKEIEDEYKPQIKAVESEILSSWTPFRITPFIMGGIRARGFTRFLQLSTPDLSKSFQDTLFRGGNIGIGLNLQVSNYWLGVTYSYLRHDNFISLSSKEYTLRTSDVSGNQTLLREKKITAYSGAYSKVETNELSIDLVGDYFINDSSRLLANLYLRGSLFSRDTAFLKNYTNIGTGLYFIGKEGKFMGGLYVELPDVNNNIEKAKPAEEMNIRTPFRKLTFGIVTKFNISSVFGFANRPVKSD